MSDERHCIVGSNLINFREEVQPLYYLDFVTREKAFVIDRINRNERAFIYLAKAEERSTYYHHNGAWRK